MARPLLPVERALCEELQKELVARHSNTLYLGLLIFGSCILGHAGCLATPYLFGDHIYSRKNVLVLIAIAAIGAWLLVCGVIVRRLARRRVSAIERLRDSGGLEETEGAVSSYRRVPWAMPTVQLGGRSLRLPAVFEAPDFRLKAGEIAHAAFHTESGDVLWIRPAELDARWSPADVRVFLEAHGEHYPDTATDAELREQVRAFLGK